MIWFTGGDTPLFGQMGMCHSTGCGLQGLLTISLFKPGQTYCVKKIMYFRRQLSRSSAQQGEAEGWTIRSTTDIFRKSPHFDSEIHNTLARLQKSCCCCFFCFLFFKIGFSRWEALAWDSRAKWTRIFLFSPHSLVLRFHSFPGLSFGLLDRSWPLHEYGLFCSLRNTPK